MGSNPISCGSSGRQQSYHPSPSVEGHAARLNEPVDIVKEGFGVIVADAVADAVRLAKTAAEFISVMLSKSILSMTYDLSKMLILQIP